jgi:hypothetical protein
MSAVEPSYGPSFFPQGYWAHVSDSQVQEALRLSFSQWGLPWGMRVDNGKPWGSWSDLPPQLALWLIGMEIEMVWIPPRRPQKNGVVERSQGTGKRWAEPNRCATVEDLQKRLDETDCLQREEYPHQRGKARLEVYPEIVHSGRNYSRDWESKHWDLQHVLAHLGTHAVKRKVDQTGNLSLYNRNHYVGVVNAEKTVFVMFDAESREWLFSDSEGRELRRRPASEITHEKIVSLNVPGNK